MSISFDIGDNVRISVALTDLDGDPADPTAVTCSTRAPDGTTASLSVVKDALGEYHADCEPDQEGSWYFRWEGTGALIVAEEGTFLVNRQRV